MKNRILLIIILILILIFIYINFFYNNSKSLSNDFTHKSNISLNLDDNNFMLNSIIKKIPTKKSNFEEPDIWSQSYILIDQNTSMILAKYNENKKVPVASTTKIMTAIIVLENYKLDEIIKISQDAATQIGDDIDLMTDEKISVYDLLLCLLIKSGNDAAYALAEHMGYNKFIEKMNEKVKYLGLKNTEFKDPAGLDDSGYSTPYDLAIMTNYALKNNTFKEIINKQNAIAKSVDGYYEHELKNSNRLIQSDELFYYDKSIGVKTGFTPDAGHCLVSAASDKNHTLISVVLNTFEDTADASAKESNKLLHWGFNNYQMQ